MALLSLGPSVPSSPSFAQVLQRRVRAAFSAWRAEREARSFEALPYDLLKDIGFRAGQDERRD
ncbi:hypothetical protein BJF93_00865 [Xaviernesmea oryzae]|uniref:DUF1127 domain-containing protein n=1 Tax=Xaviernesmea oryzae TaxID=464029 RepID=A0A1Q9B0P8_9HYPH|nr:hypothetical protein BJF93_00865 [Xaviernesmea oryzae]